MKKDKVNLEEDGFYGWDRPMLAFKMLDALTGEDISEITAERAGWEDGEGDFELQMILFLILTQSVMRYMKNHRIKDNSPVYLKMVFRLHQLTMLFRRYSEPGHTPENYQEVESVLADGYLLPDLNEGDEKQLFLSSSNFELAIKFFHELLYKYQQWSDNIPLGSEFLTDEDFRVAVERKRNATYEQFLQVAKQIVQDEITNVEVGKILRARLQERLKAEQQKKTEFEL